MKKATKILIASCLLCSAVAIGGTAVAIAETGSAVAIAETRSSVSTTRKDLGYAPDITVNWGEYSAENIPNAVKDTPYQLFTATAEDIYSEKVAVKTRVYLNYFGNTKNLITVKNNSVTPKYYGVYTVEYTATDVFGNVSVYTYDFKCDDVETLTVSLTDQETKATAGVETPIAQYAYENEEGNVTTKITATHKGGKAVYDLTDKTSFVPMYAGDYTIEYACTDYNLTVKESYDITVEKNNAPVFFGTAAMPKYFIVGKEYTLPSVEAYQFVTGNPAPIRPSITVKQGKEKEKELNGYSYTSDKEGEVTITYTIACGEYEETQSYTVHAVDVGEAGTDTFDIAKYFYASENTVVTADSDSLTVTTATNGATVEFINTLSSNTFSIELATVAQTTNFDALNIYLKDSSDESVQLKLTYANPGRANSSLCVNDGDTYDTKFSESSVQLISYNETTKKVNFNGNIFINCPKGFEGFPSGKINFSVEFVGVKGRSELKVYGINNQVLTEWDADYFAPEIWYTTDGKSLYQINDLISLGSVIVGDVLDTDAKLYVDVLAPSQEYVVSEAGYTLRRYTGDIANCDFRVTEYGNYLVRFTAEDSSGNSKLFAYSVTVKDIVPPKASLANKMPETVKVGEAFKVADVIVNDDLSAAENCKVEVIALGPTGDAVMFTAGKTYSLQTKGVYYLYYVVTDEAGNVTMFSHKLIVE